MPKFEVTVKQVSYEVFKVLVNAENEEQAKEEAITLHSYLGELLDCGFVSNEATKCEEVHKATVYRESAPPPEGLLDLFKGGAEDDYIDHVPF